MKLTEEQKIQLRDKIVKIVSADKDNARKVEAIFEVVEAIEEEKTEEPLDKPAEE